MACSRSGLDVVIGSIQLLLLPKGVRSESYQPNLYDKRLAADVCEGIPTGLYIANAIAFAIAFTLAAEIQSIINM
jgi:hypothetical protein